MNFTSVILTFFSLIALHGNASETLANLALTGGRTNYTDTDGLRQGYWKILGSMTIEEGFQPEALVEEGGYVDNKREGVWKKYFPTGDIRSEIAYSENHPYGHYKTFFANGNVEEEGYWKSNKNTGEFYRYHENGSKAQVFNFNSNGKRDGEQNYFYENGSPQIVVELDNGVAHGNYYAFYIDGKLRESRRYTNGELEAGSDQTFESKKDYVENAELALSLAETTPDRSDQPNLSEFLSTGFNTLYNRNKQLSQVGMFKDGRIWDGKWYKYDDNGLLLKLEIYKAGRFIGYGIIDDSDK